MGIFGQENPEGRGPPLPGMDCKTLSGIGLTAWPVFMWVHGPWFYQVNSLKLATALILSGIFLGLLGFCRKFGPFSFQGAQRMPWLRITFALMLPSLAGIPGVLFHGPAYNFPYNLGTDLICISLVITWVALMGTPLRSLTIFLASCLIGLILLTIGGLGYRADLWLGFLREVTGPDLTFGNANYAAGFLAMVLPLYIALIGPQPKGISPRFSRKLPWIGVTGALVCVGLLLHTESRAGLALAVLLPLLFALLLFVRARSRNRFHAALQKVLRIATLPVLVSSGLLLFLRREEFSSLMDVTTWYGRLLPWKVAWESILASPWFGYGLGSSYSVFFQFLPPEARLYTDNLSYNHVHNEHLQLMQDTGFFGYGLLVVAFTYLLVRLLRLWLQHPPASLRGRMALGLSLSLMAYAAQGSLSVAQRMVVTHLPLYLCFVSAITLLWPNRRSRNNTRQKRFRFLPFAAVMAVATAAAFIMIPWLHRQFQHVVAVQQFNNQPTKENAEALIDQLKHSRDIYALHTAATIASKINDSARGLFVCRRISSIIPHYRNVDALHAVFLTLEGKLEEASAQSKEVLHRDAFHPTALSLQAALAAYRKEFIPFYQTLQKNIKRAFFLSPEYRDLPPDRMQTEMHAAMVGLVSVADKNQGEALIRFNRQWAIRLFQYFSLPDPGVVDWDPQKETRQLVSRTRYARIPFRSQNPTTDQINTVQRLYQQRKELLAEKEDLTSRKQENLNRENPSRTEHQRIKTHLEVANRKLHRLEEDLNQIVFLEDMIQRQSIFDQIVTFVHRIEKFHKLLLQNITNIPPG